MREIKFRAWDINRKHMEYVTDLYWFEETGVHKIENNIGQGHYGKYLIIQYTGLKDKNGKEIYEGDILLDEDFGQRKRAKGFVIYQVYEFVIKKSKRASSWYNLTNLASGENSWEIIGNIYENPELLKELK